MLPTARDRAFLFIIMRGRAKPHLRSELLAQMAKSAASEDRGGISQSRPHRGATSALRAQPPWVLPPRNRPLA